MTGKKFVYYGELFRDVSLLGFIEQYGGLTNLDLDLEKVSPIVGSVRAENFAIFSYLFDRGDLIGSTTQLGSVIGSAVMQNGLFGMAVIEKIPRKYFTDIWDDEIWICPEFNEPIIHAAARKGCLQVFSALLLKGLDPQVQNEDGEDAFSLAETHGNIEIMRLLRP